MNPDADERDEALTALANADEPDTDSMGFVDMGFLDTRPAADEYTPFQW